MIFKKLFNQALIVWDHCVYVRERLLWYDTEKAMPFLVRDTLARLHRAAAEVLYAEADLVTPCCATFNVNWEQWLGHAPETIMPVVNGLDFNQVKISMQWLHVQVSSTSHMSCIGTDIAASALLLLRPLSSSVCRADSQIVVFAAQSYAAVLSSHHTFFYHALCNSSYPNCLSSECDVAVQDSGESSF